MELRLVLRGLIAFCLEVCVFHGLVAGATTTGFPSLDTIRSSDVGTRTLRNRDQWLFPSIVFACTGTITKWTFRARNSQFFMNGLPELQVWRQQTITPNPDSYMLVSSSGSEAELQGAGPVYEYVLQPPIEVQEGDIFGVFLANRGAEHIAVEYLDLGEGNASNSYWISRPPQAPMFRIIPNVTAGNLDQRYLPLVTAEFSLGAGATTSVVLPSPTPSPPPSSSTPGPPSVISTPQSTPSQPSAVSTGLAIPTNPSSTPRVVVPPPGGGGGGGSSAGKIAGAVIAILLAVGIVVLGVIVILLMRRRRQRGVYVTREGKPQTVENPTYQGVLSDPKDKTLSGKSTSSNGSYHVYALPGQLDSPHPAEGVPSGVLTGHYEFADDIIPNSLESHYKMEPQTSRDYDLPSDTGTGTSTLAYDQPSDTGTGTSTLASQYEIPVAREPKKEGRQREPVYSVLEKGIFVPTEEERTNTGGSNGTLFDGNGYDKIYAQCGKKYKRVLRDGEFFKQEVHYWKPASSRTALYAQLSMNKYREILRHQIQIIEHLGAGQFGTVNKGLWQSPDGTMEVAVKTLQPNASEMDKVKFLQEAAIMGQFLHPDVVKLHGVVTVGQPVMIVLEFMPKGDLRNYLRSRQPNPGEMVSSDLPELLLRFCRQTASGLNYLSNKAFVHRDVAARNILVDADNTCKIGDFGMSRDLEDNHYYITHGGKIPVKWTAPEALHFRKYSTASDVWSFGAVMYEIWSLGHKPFEGYTNQQAMQLIASGFRLPPPPGCPRPLYELMIRCWHADASVRPTFSAIVKMLSHSDAHLLQWGERDMRTHPQAASLGAPLEAGDELYPDLQDCYMDEKSKR